VVFPLYHPAAILYNRGLESELHADLEAMVALLGWVSP
jgi:uracil-DNA glycosylase